MSNYHVVPVLTRNQKDLRKSFQSADSTKQMIKLLNKMEGCFPEYELGMEFLILAHRFHTQGGSPQQVLYFGKRALQILIRNDDNNIPCVNRSWSMLISAKNQSIAECTHNRSSSFYIACLCNYLGVASLELKRFNESLSYLNWADRNFNKLLELDVDSRCTGNCVLHMIHSTQSDLIRIKVAMDKKEEMVVHAKKILVIKEMTDGEGSIGFADGNMIVADAYFILDKFEESLPFYMKAFYIYTKHIRDGSVEKELAHVSENLRTIYAKLEEHNKAL